MKPYFDYRKTVCWRIHTLTRTRPLLKPIVWAVVGLPLLAVVMVASVLTVLGRAGEHTLQWAGFHSYFE